MPEAFRKTVENRTWYTSYRGPLLIHAGKSRAWMEDIDRHPLYKPLRGQTLPFGMIIGLVEMVDCIPIAKWEEKHPNDPWAFGPWCHVYRAPELLAKPIPYRGAQGLFEVPDSILRTA